LCYSEKLLSRKDGSLKTAALRLQLQTGRARTDEVFALIGGDAFYDRPIPERHRLVFYLGHLEAFDWNLICKGGFEMDSFHPEFDRLFAFGIDPTSGHLPNDVPQDWPELPEIRRYNARVHQAVDVCLEKRADDQLFHVAIEHRFMHAETLAYMMHFLPFSAKRHRDGVGSTEASWPIAHRQIEIPSGTATLGLNRDGDSFGWDNEFDAHAVDVSAFAIDKYKVTNAQYLEFVRAGGYAERSFWSETTWDWIEQTGTVHPKFWMFLDGRWLLRTMFAEIPIQPAWPVYVSHAEAEAYARWKGQTLPTEAQFHRAAFGSPSGLERAYPWGDDAPEPHRGNFDFASWDPSRVDAYPAGDSAFGVSGLTGNGWEWTSAPFAPFDGFEPFVFYPEYSAAFFDGNHYVIKGGSARTSSLLLRRSFRNWFQPKYPNVYAGFRCVQN